MAECEEWVVGEDGCLSVGEATDGITYHPTLNTILVTTKEPAVKVLDVNSGTLLQKSTLSATPNFKVNCIYLPNQDKVFFTDGHSVGLRRDHNGVLLLDTILQTPVSRGDDIVRIELPLTEAWQLYQCLIDIDLQGLVLTDDLIKILEEEVCVGQIGTKGSSKATKWYTVCLALPHNTLKTFCSSLVQELKKLNRYIPALAIASAISERLNLLLPNNPSDGGSTSAATVDRSLMYSESARRETFGKWPHMNYKWALPDQMAQAGFYHQPNSTGDDRAMCFTCSVCLVCWEPTDEPWSEHERHSPSCPFVKGEYTQNVPLSVTYATNPAILHGDKQEEIHCVSPASNCDLMATSTKNGCIVVWNVSKQLKKEIQFCIDPGDPLLISKDLHPVHKKVGLPKQAWVEEKSETEIETTQTSTNSQEEGSETPIFDPIVEIPLDDISLDELLTSARPTDDIEISSICIASSLKSFQDGGSESLNSNRPSLISGVRLLRRDNSSPRAAVNSTSRGINSDDSPLVQALNDVNEASSREMPLDIMRVQENSSSTAIFVPCILVYDFHLQTLGPYLETKPSTLTTNVKKLSSATSSGTQQECNSLYGDFGDLLSEICDDTLDPMCGLKFVDPGPFTSISNSSGIKFGGPSGSTSEYPNPESNVIPSTATQVDIQLSRMDLREKFRSGCLIQCVELPINLQKENFVISFLTTTLDEKYLLVTVNYRTDCDKGESTILTARQDAKTHSANSFNNDLSLSFAKNNEDTKFINTNTDKLSEKCTGAFLLYKLNFTTEAVTLEEKPTKVFLFEKLTECVKAVMMLPLEATDYQEEQLNALTTSNNPVGHFVAVTYEGSIRLHELTSLKVVAEFSSSEEFISVTYCSSIERICASSANGNLHFLHLWPCRKLIQENESNIEENISNGRTVFGYKDGNISVQASSVKEQEAQVDDGIDLLVKQPLTQEALTYLHELVQFESLIPRFSATVPSCWTEIQQEQKQRRHPQHLQQQGEAMQHTRSWRLQHDCNTWDEHLFEITLPKSCCIGHIDFKFNLHPVCTTPPNIQITLLKQNTGGIGRLEKDIPSNDNEVDSGIDFNTFAQSEPGPAKDNPISSQGTDNPVLTPEFLIAHNAELLCGPLDISSYVDLSGQSGIVTLTSPELFAVKTRTFLIHLKAFINKKDLVNKADGLCNRRCSKLPTMKPKLPVLTNAKVQTNKASLHQQYLVKVKDKLGGVPSLQSLLEYYAPPGSAVERLAATAPNKKIDNLKGCDWFHEISITIRRTKRTNIPHERIQRCAMLESQCLQEKLIQVICGEDKLNQTISIEQRQHLALDILIWIAAIQMNKKSLSDDNLCLFNIQANLSPLIKSCFIDGTRSIAHKCAKLIIICLEHSKIMKDQDISPVFNYLLLQGLLEWLPSFPQCQSAGALRWLCLLLNRVKCLNVATVGQKCMELLVALSKQLNERTSPLHSLLRARFGLYGTPFEPELYDIEPPPPLKPSSTPLTYACVVASSNNANNNSTQNQNATVSTEELDLRGLLNIGSCDHLFLNRYLFTFPGQHLKGLLEVEPLHFTCHAASDGTKMEKIELGPGSGSSGTGTLPLSSNVFEQLPQYLPPPSGFTSWTGSLSSLFSTLKKKQEEFLKLQQQHKKLEQKLAETVFPNQANLIPFSTKKSKISPLAVQSNPYPGTVMVTSTSIPSSSAFTFHVPTSIKSSPHIIAGSTMNSDESTYIGLGENEEKTHVKFASKTTKETKKDTSSMPTTMMLSPWQQLLQPPPQQALVIERMHSGARRFVVLDFGKQILLTDLMIPSCSDLVSLSIDIWTQAEEIDGQRLVVTTDIGIRSLVMSDLQPPPVCRFLKITTIGRYGMNSTRCRIPIGTFYGHTFILPWELISGTPVSLSKVDDAGEGKPYTFDIVENQIQSQLNILSSLLEDIHCRYSLACDKLFNLLSPLLPTEQNNANHTNIYLQREKDKLSEEDQHIVSAYQDCLQLQQQLNLVTNTISRLERAQGSELAPVKHATSPSTSSFLKTICTDKLRVLSECLLDVLLGLTYPTPSIPQLPASLYMAFDQKNCETLFRFLCVNGTRRMQLNASTLLVRMCGLQPWWGSFVARMLVNLYNSEQTLTFPQDRVFILLTYLGQKSLTCSSTPTVLESVINLLEQLLMPLIDRNINFVRGVLDIPLIGWVLLFLSVCLDNIGNGNHSSGDDGDMKSCPKDKDAGSVSNRWDFIQGEVAMLKNKASTMKSSSVSVSSRLYRRKLQKRLMHHKQQLEDLEQAKKAFLASTQAMSALHSHLSSKGGSTSTYKELEAAVKQQEQIFKKALKQHSAKHFKDILQIRRTDGPLLTKTNSVTPNNAANGSEKEDADNDLSFFLPLSRSQTLPVAKGLVSLLLAMDFTCNVDMFLLACKVLGRISVSTRPAICLGEIFTQEQLSHLVQLCVGVESHANSTAWGGPWASHAITCLLQDILEGERLFPSSFTSHEESPTEEELPNLASGTDDSLQQASSSQLPADVVDAVPADNIPESTSFQFIKDLPGVVDSEDSESDECNWEIFDEPHPAKKLTPGPNKKSWTGIFSAIKGQKEGRSQDSSNSNLYTSANTVSTAVDARLEFGVEMSAEMRLKILTTLEADGLSNAICAPLQVPPEGAIQELSEETYETENSDIADLNGVPFDVTSSLDMLGQCFDQIFSQLQVLQINLESLLQLWLTLIEEVNTDSPGGPSGFDPGIIPVIPLSANAVSGLLAALTWYPTISLRTWCLAFQTLTLVSNLKSSANDCSSPDGSGPSNWRAQSLESSQEPLDLSQNWMGVVIVNDANLLPVLMKFLSGTGLEHGLSAIRNSVGPSVTQALHDFIIRLQLRCDVITPGSKLGCHLKELLLKLIHLLISNSGAIQNFHGPLDAQCKFIDLLQNLRFDNLDITIAMNVITATVTLVHNYIVSTERVICRSSIETGVNPSSCFGGLFAPVLRGDGKCNSVTGNRDMLVCSLLKLVNRLIQAPLLEPRTTNIVRTPLSGTTDSESLDKTGMNPELLTDSTKIEQQAGSCSTDITVTEAQTDEHKTAAASSSHGTTARCNHSAIASNSVRTVYVADSVLQHQPTMLRLLSALASCTGSTMAMLLGSSGINSASSADSSDRFVLGEPVSVGDSVFHLLCTMNRKASCINLILQPIFNYMSSNPFEELPSSGLIVVPRLSEPLLWFILKVLDCESALSEFLNMGGIQVICQNLVHSNHQLINSHPSFVSAVMQYLSNSRSVGQNTKHQGTDLETVDGLINFAPLGAISSSNPTAQPADVLIQAAPPHRRARTPAWSYHFYPEESWIDLTITLPCAVLLKEIHIQPHLTSLATCPSAVSVEVSRDGYTGSTPLCPPQPTNGLTFIRLQLTRPEIITSVTLRLHKPRDSSNIGLSQVLLLGSTTFGEAVAKSRTATMPSEDNVTRSSLGWLRILHHCLTLPVSLSIRQLICQATVSVPYLLRACCTLLLTPALGIYMTHIEHVLLQLGLHSTDVGLKEIDILLHSSGWAHTQDASQSLFHNSAVDSVVEIVYQLCITQDEGTKSRVEAVLKWLVNAAQKAIQQHLESGHKPWQSFPLFGSSRTSPAITFVQCVAAILWHLHETLNDLDLTSLISENMFRLLYEWSMTLSARSALKRAVDLVLCSLCYICPEYFNKLLLWMGILVPSSSVISSSDAAISDDRKNPISLTDDSKEAGADDELVLQDICCMNIEESHLMTLATVSQSPVAIRQLLDSGFLSLLAHSILDFCNKEALICNANPPTEMKIKTISEEPISGQSQTDNLYSGMPSTSKNEYIESEFHLNPAELEHVSKPVWYANVNPSNHEGMTDAAKAGNSKYCQKTFTKPEFLVSAEFVAAALNFFKEICSEGVIRDWLGGPEGNIFWLPLLLMLCDPNLRSSTSHYEVRDNLKTTSLSSQQRSAIEVSTLHLLTHCCWAHPSNQLLLSQVLCEVIRQQGSTQQDGSMGFIHAISGFTRRLILQLLLENEKIQVFVKSTQPLPKCSIGLSSNQPQHPRFGCGHHFRLLYISTQTTCSDIIKNVSDVSGLIHTPPVPEHKDEKEPIKKDITEIGLELVDHLSVAAGVTAKDKRQRDVKPPIPERRDHNGSETVNPPANSVSLPTSILTHELIPNQVLPPSLILAQLLTLLEERGHSLSSTSLTLTVTQVRKSRDSRDGIDGNNVIPESVLLGCTPLPTTLQVFASIGGLALLAQHLPLLYPEITRYSSPVYRTAAADKSGTDLNTGLDSEWVKVEATEDIYDLPMEQLGQPSVHPVHFEDFPEFIPPGASSPQSSRSNPVPPPSIPPHSLAAFGLFLRLPGYAEVLLKERKKAQCLLRLALGITDNGEGGDIFQSPMASSLPTLPFQILQQLFDSTPLTTDDGVLLRRMTLEVGAIHLLLACLAALSHQSCDINLPGFQNELIMAAAKAVSNAQDSTDKTDDKSHLYWAKGTGFGTGSTNQSWDVEQAIMRQRSEEEHVTCLLQVLSSYINPGGHIPSNFNSKDSGSSAADEDISPPVLLPSVFYDLLYQSCLLPAISSYLRNDSVLDMARHVPLYRALLQLLRAVAVSSQLVGLLLPIDLQDSSLSVCSLLAKMKTCVDTYASRLKLNKNKGNGKAKGKSVAKLKEEDEENEGLAQLIPDIQKTARIVHLATKRMLLEEDNSSEDFGDKYSDSSLTVIQTAVKSLEERYIEVMKKLQFDTYEMIVEEDDTIRFIVSHHFESNMRASWDNGHPARARRLAQETVTLSTSLPLSFSSSVFVRCDQDRLDIMKVLITGPSDTPYANGCFEFDVYFPPDYPNSPMLINLETTGHHTVRFNPNLYNDGKVCLSVLNTWHGRPEEKWNPQTSSFLQVLVSIQSLILVSEPYFNEPGYERSRGSPSGNQSSREYDSNIRQANVKWAMLEQIRNPCPCFKEVIHKHFWMKRAEIVQQIDSWISEMDAQGSDRRTGRTIALNCVALKRHFSQLKEEFMKMKAPEGLEDFNDILDLSNNHMASDGAAVTSAESSSRESPDSAHVSVGPI